MLVAVKGCGDALKHAAPTLRGDPEVVLIDVEISSSSSFESAIAYAFALCLACMLRHKRPCVARCGGERQLSKRKFINII